MKLFNFNSNKKPAKPGAKNAPKKKFILSRKQKIIAIVGGVLVLGGAGYGVYAAYTMDEVNAGGCVSSMYKKGAVSSCVKYAQQMLGMKDAGSRFGKDVYNKVADFQGKYGLTADGIIGPKTWNKLCTKGVNATAKKNAGCDDTSSSSSSKDKTGWTSLGRLASGIYADNDTAHLMSANIKACKKVVRNGTYVVKVHVRKHTSKSSLPGDITFTMLSSNIVGFQKMHKVNDAWNRSFDFTIASGVNVSGNTRFKVEMDIFANHGAHSDTTDFSTVDSLLTCS